MKFKSNLFLVNALIVTLAIAFSTGFFLTQVRNEALQLAQNDQEEALRTFWQLLRDKGTDFRVVDGRLMAGDYVINGNYELPDRVREIFGGTATIFMGDTRVSTNVLKPDGSRATGTRLVGPAYDAIYRNNVPFRGEALILGIPYLTAYDPIRDRSGKTIGVLYVGVKKSELLTDFGRLRFDVIAGAVIIEVLFVGLGFVLLWERSRYEERLRTMAEALHGQLGFLQTLIDTIPSPIFYKDRGGRYLGCNRAFGDHLGATGEKLIGKTVYDVAPKDLADRYFAMDEALFTNPGEQVYDSSILYADGTRHDVIFSKATFTDGNGRLAGLVGVILDVTERKRAEDAIAQREEFLSNILDSIQDGISILDAELRIVRVNPVIETRFSNGGALAGRKCHEVYHGSAEPCELCPSLETLRTGKPSSKIFSVAKSGADLWLELHTYPLFDAKKCIIGVIEHTRDITERRRAEEALADAEKKFRGLVEQSLVGTYIIRDGRFAYVNPKLAEIFGYTQEEITAGMTPRDLTAERDRARVAEFIRQRIAGEVQSVHYLFRGVRRDGTEIHAEVYGTRFDLNGRTGVIGTLLDVTDRKRAEDALRESEERFHQIFVQNGDAIILVRLDTFSVIDANPAAEELTGYSREELQARPPTSFIDPGDFRTLIAMITPDEHALPFQLHRAAGTRKDGSAVAVALRGKIIRLGNEYVIHCSIRDITEKARLEEEIRTTQARLIHASKMTSLGMLASSIAHEVNNPNNYIGVNASMLADAWRDAAPVLRRLREEHGDFQIGGLPCSEMEELAPRLFKGIAEGSRRINTIITNMKDYVKPDQGGSAREFDLNRAVRDAATILWHHIHRYTDNFSLSLAESLPPARGSRQQIEQVVINLIMNALQALPDKGAAVSAATGYDREAGVVTVTVRDEGAGMEEEVLSRLTEPFFTTKIDEGGTGLGLYISASIVREHSGALEFDSAPGRGTTVTVRLPAAGHACASDA